jgi:hypothetical protein
MYIFGSTRLLDPITKYMPIDNLTLVLRDQGGFGNSLTSHVKTKTLFHEKEFNFRWLEKYREEFTPAKKTSNALNPTI